MTADAWSGYAAADDPGFSALYRAQCHCGAVAYEVGGEPVDAKICHCRDCQVLHGAPMQWAVIFDKLALFGFIEMMVFLAILLVGYLYAWRRGALEWA